MTVEFWRMGASPVPVSDTGRLAREFEADGWDGLAVGEAHGILPDPYAALAAAAMQTTRLRLGTAVAVPLRTPLLAASAMATIHAISGGRSRFCVARGDGAMKVLGREPIAVRAFTTYLEQLQGFLRGDEMEVEGGTTSLARMPVIDNSYQLPKVPVDVAATGPRMIATAARLADGVSFAVGADIDRLQRCIEQALAARVEAALDPDALALGCYVQIAVVTGDAPSAHEAIRGLVMTHARFSGYEGKALPDVADSDHNSIRSAVTAMHATLRTGHRSIAMAAGARPNEVNFYPDAVDDRFVDRFGIIGKPEYCAQRLQEIIDLGITRIYIGTRGVGVDPLERNTARIAHEVLPLVRRRNGF
jgi:5,10-methylenetetrahydromethanopterin reductase